MLYKMLANKRLSRQRSCLVGRSLQSAIRFRILATQEYRSNGCEFSSGLLRKASEKAHPYFARSSLHVFPFLQYVIIFS